MDYQKLLEEIKSKIDIVDFISEYINLTKTGQNYRALCPFHPEKTPSFFVSPSKQIFHCFGCGKGGDLLSFLMEYEKLSFIEALSMLATKAGIELPINKSSTYSIPKDKLYQIYEIATEIYSKKLSESQIAQRYLKERGINQESIEIFKVGYAPEEKDFLYQHLKKQGFDEKIIKFSGLIHNFMDFFRDRIIIPIHDLTGRVVAFGGRIIQQDSKLPKYINSSDTPIFKKGNSIFGLWQAKQYIRQKGYAILMEGYLDVILSHQYGFKNSVAPLGTALTQEQLNKLKRFTNKVVIVFDSDEAGTQAAEKILQTLFQKGFIVKIARLPDGQDPASILQRYGEKTFKNFIAKALSPVDFILETKSKKTLNEKVYELLHKIAYMNNLIYRDELIKELSEKSTINELTLREEIKKILTSLKKERTFEKKSGTNVLNEEETLLRIALSFPDKIQPLLSKIELETLENQIVRQIFYKIKNITDTDKKEAKNDFTVDKFLNTLTEEEKRFVSKLIISAEIDEDYIMENLKDCIKRLKIKFIDKKIKELSKSADKNLLQNLIRQKKEILRNSYEGL
ncbi:DNA primase [Thermodesulfovibrio sp. 1176]|uniref:DNA primase n=1 Tax=Thermodesulfovibrio sp. 1176 TaxID=3043424 RepID=UPI002482F9A8|nr:DNA primase [Thermodesulfovibrio sp. 1176]MDI1472916.1 DNA primase [Thermodesulfovibrio sp. 1176]